MLGGLDARALEPVTPPIHVRSQQLLRFLLICHNLPSPLFITSLYTSMETTAVSLQCARKREREKDWTVQIMALACRTCRQAMPIELPSSASGRLYTTADWLPSPSAPANRRHHHKVCCAFVDRQIGLCRPILRRRPGEHGPWL